MSHFKGPQCLQHEVDTCLLQTCFIQTIERELWVDRQGTQTTPSTYSTKLIDANHVLRFCELYIYHFEVEHLFLCMTGQWADCTQHRHLQSGHGELR